jgi:hypothetical protein
MTPPATPQPQAINTTGGALQFIVADSVNVRTLAYVAGGTTEMIRRDATDSEWWLCQQLYQQQQSHSAALQSLREERDAARDLLVAEERVWLRRQREMEAERDQARAEAGGMREALREIAAEAFSAMEGAGMPEFGYYDRWNTRAQQALAGGGGGTQ